MPSLTRVTVLKLCAAADLLRSVMNLAAVTTQDTEADLVKIERRDNILVERVSDLAGIRVIYLVRAIAKSRLLLGKPQELRDVDLKMTATNTSPNISQVIGGEGQEVVKEGADVEVLE